MFTRESEAMMVLTHIQMPNCCSPSWAMKIRIVNTITSGYKAPSATFQSELDAWRLKRVFRSWLSVFWAEIKV
jgi:hypothetical protein